MTTSAATGNPPRKKQLILGLIAMMAISSPQYVWALFTQHLTSSLGASLAEVQVTFSILIVLQTFLSPLQGFLIDRFGPHRLLAIGAALTGLSWIVSSDVQSLTGLYLSYGVLGGIGTGVVYVGVIGLMVQWFPDLRGFATGMVAAGYGFGAVLTTFPISASMKTDGFQETLFTYGIVIGLVGILAALGMRRPNPGELSHIKPQATQAVATKRDFTPKEMLVNPIFWLLFLMMTMMSTTGLMVISQMGAIARDFKVADALVFGMAALPFALTIDRITNGLTRPFFGWVSDKLGREKTMLIAFSLEGAAITVWYFVAHDPLWFALLSGVVFFGWGEIFSLFPSILTDTFGTKHATTNYGFLYMAQGVGSVFGGPVAALIYASTGTWGTVFTLVVIMDILTAVLAYFVLMPMRKKHLAATGADVSSMG
ncbi:MAG TPA: oxalate/formate MFS antiporter [Rhodocyclaceae bacterium]|nr:oxalate/formate MFS antiporter [Rhodocyclaceae bacterium]